MINNEELNISNNLTAYCKVWKIYLHRNKINNKCYVGQTCRKYVKTRWFRGKGYDYSTKFHNAIKKYGWDNFEHIILEDNLPTRQLANEREIYWINFYNSIDNGYNTKKGGTNGVNENLYKPVVMIDINNGNILNIFDNIQQAAETLGGNCQSTPICACCRGKVFSAYGYLWCYKSKLDSWNYYEHIKSNKLKKSIFKLDKNTLHPVKMFLSMKDAQKELSLSYEKIKKICEIGQDNKLDYYLCYSNDYSHEWKPTIKELRVTHKEGKICMLDKEGNVVKKFNSITLAKKETGAHNILSCLNGNRNKSGNYYWCYEKYLSNFVVREPKHTKEKNCKRVYQFDLNGNFINSFNSISQASQCLIISISNISACALGKRKTAGGYIWNFNYEGGK